MSSSEIRTVLVGLGVRGETWATVCANTESIALVAAVDKNPAMLAKHNSGIPLYEEFDDALEATDPDAVIIATPPETHYEIASKALSASKHVLCEKPLSYKMGQVIKLVELAERNNVNLLVGMNFRHLSTSQMIRNYSLNQILGPLSHGQFSYLRYRDGNRTDLNKYPLQMAYPMLFEQSIHHFDLLRYCYNKEVISLVADSFRPSWSTYENDCCISVLFRFEDNIHVNYLGTWTSSYNGMRFHWSSEFSNGMLEQRSQFDNLVRVDFNPELGLTGPRFKSIKQAEPAQQIGLKPCVPFIDDSHYLLLELVNAIRKIRPATTTGRDHLFSLLLVQACIESTQTRQWIDVEQLHKNLLPTHSL